MTRPVERLVVLSHHKCATVWLLSMLQAQADHLGASLWASHHTSERPDAAPLVLVRNAAYDTALEHASFGVHVVRNPLDLVVSAYYSHLHSHPLTGWPELAAQRGALERVDLTSGLAATITFLERSDFYATAPGPLHALRRWDFDDTRFTTVRQEDLVSDPALARRLLSRCPDDVFAAIWHANSFAAHSGGRAPGEVDPQAHFRSGRAGDWRGVVPEGLARAVYVHHRTLFDRWYPDDAALLR